MDFKKDIELILNNLKNKGYSRNDIEKALNYKNNYIDQMLAKRGNKRFLKALADFEIRVLQKNIPEVIEEKPAHGIKVENLTDSVKFLSQTGMINAEKDKINAEKDKINAESLKRLITLLELKMGVTASGIDKPFENLRVKKANSGKR